MSFNFLKYFFHTWFLWVIVTEKWAVNVDVLLDLLMDNANDDDIKKVEKWIMMLDYESFSGFKE